MSSSPPKKLTASLIFLLFAAKTSHVYATYNGGIGVGPLFNSDEDDIAGCPPGTELGTGSTWCCPTGTQIDLAQDSDIVCCPTAADCTNDLINSGIQCADPSMTLFKYAGSLICCPAGYFVNDERYCVNSGAHMFYTSTAQSGSLTPDGSSPTGTAGGGSAMPSNSAEPTTTDDGSAATSTPAAAGTSDTGAATITPAATAGGATSGGAGGIVNSKTTSSGASTSTNLAAAGANADAGAGIMGAVLAVGGLLLV